jgi:hypothetical protein
MNMCARCFQPIRLDAIAVSYKGELYHGKCFSRTKEEEERNKEERKK